MNQVKIRFAVAGLLYISFLMPFSAYAHLMVAQHGTLNFMDDSAYMVLSLPASAFSNADENKDGRLSITEFSDHRESIVDVVLNNVSLGNKNNLFTLHNLMVSPVTPHGAPADPADQIIAMGRFSVSGDTKTLYFSVDLFGVQQEKKLLEITAKRKKSNDEHTFELSPEVSRMKLNFNQIGSIAE